MKKILFTGSAGKVGRLIIPFLIGNGYEIEYYDKLDDYVFDFSKLQCVVSNIDIYNSVSFGKTQAPDLEDYADNIDTIDFLLKN